MKNNIKIFLQGIYVMAVSGMGMLFFCFTVISFKSFIKAVGFSALYYIIFMIISLAAGLLVVFLLGLAIDNIK